MKAIGFRRYGPAEVLEPLDVPKPVLKPDSVLMRVAAASVNPADWRIRNGQFRFFIKVAFPFVPGADVAGVVTEIGSAVTRFRPGDAVYALLPTAVGGGYAEYAAAAEAAIASVPASLTLAEAAAIPLTALTALQALRDKANLQSGNHILINGGAGGVGTFAVQIAKAMGARVTATCSGRNADLVHRLGADEVLDYTREAITTGKTQYDVVFDAVNTYPFWGGLGTLRPNGVLVSVNPVLAMPVTQGLARLRRRRLQSILVQPSGVDLEALNRWIVKGAVRPVIDRCYPLAEAAAAHRHSETQRVRGKLVLIVDEPLAASRSG